MLWKESGREEASKITTLPQIWKNILIWLGIKKDTSKGQQNALEFAFEYNNKSGINLTYVASNKIANIVTTDSQINVTSDSKNKRTDFLQECASKVWRYKKRIASRAAGLGKVCLFPYTDDGKSIKFDIVPQANILVFAEDGEKATDIAALCDTSIVNKICFGKFKRYTLKDGIHIITEFYANLTTNTMLGEAPPSGAGWVPMEPFVINNVSRLLFGEISCPIDPRNDDKFYAAKITDGCDDIIKDIQEQFEYLANEYNLKKAFIGADETLFRKDHQTGKYKLPDSQLFKIMDTGIDNFFQVFDPAIRADPIYTRLKATFEQLENHIGLSRGIYTNPENVGAYNNTSNIKRSIFDTYAFVTDFRDNIRYGITDYLYSCNVLAEHFGMTPQGVDFSDISVRIDWSNAIIEDSAEEFNQYAEGVAQGVISRPELRQWITGEDIDTATKNVEDMQGNLPLEE